MTRPVKRHLRVLCALLSVTATGLQAQAVAPAVETQDAAWGPVSFGPYPSELAPCQKDCELRVRGDQLVVAGADGQQWAWPLASIQRITYYRKTTGPSALVGHDFNPVALLFQHTYHVMVLDCDDTTDTVILRLDKAVYRHAIATIHKLTGKPVHVSPDDAKALPAGVVTQLPTSNTSPPPMHY